MTKVTDSKEEISERCLRLSSAARDAVAWIDDPENAETIDRMAPQVVRKLGSFARRADKLASAAKSNMAVSVFGPSQAGKSYLVSVLARPEGGQLVADYAGPGGQLDYISQINPAGEGESTGIVTRFTMTRIQTPEGYPIPLRLLNESDVARTIINSFFRDSDQEDKPPTPEAIAEHLQTYRAKMGAACKSMTADGVWEIAEYVEKTFARAAYADRLQLFWEGAARIAPFLSLGDRAAFLSVLWAGHQPLTDLFLQLAEASEKLNCETEIFAPLSALVPRETSIIDVAALSGLFDGSDKIEVVTAGGQKAAVERGVLCALTAELVLPMREQPHELFRETDLLDFPGARNRLEKPLSVTLQKPEENVPEMLLRGKVAYLFDRYVDHQEITSMLLCIPPSNMDTTDLPLLVDTWIAMTHGDRPQKRKDVECILFFILTKFDMHLGKSAGEAGESFRFNKRIEKSLLERFGRLHDPWVEQWTPGTPFKNCYWLRNPNFYNDALFDYEDVGGVTKERLKADQKDHIAKLKAGCLEAENVRNHFDDPDVAWDAAMAENDGGVGRLLAGLEPVCKLSVKLEQILSQVSDMEAEILSDIGKYHVSTDIDKRVAEMEALASEVIENLDHVLETQNFGAFISRLMVDEDRIFNRVYSVPPDVRIGAQRPAKTERIRPGAPPRPTAGDSEGGDASGGDSVKIMTRESFQSNQALQSWAETLQRFKDEPDLEDRLGVRPDVAASLVSELLTGARRYEIERRMSEALARIQFGLTLERQARPAAVILGETINRFVSTLGYAEIDEAKRPVIEGPEGKTPVFKERPHALSIDDLPAEPRSIVDRYWTHWVHALFDLYRSNAQMVDGADINHEQNARIGRIIASIENKVAAE
jgi:hypothetical protein